MRKQDLQARLSAQSASQNSLLVRQADENKHVWWVLLQKRHTVVFYWLSSTAPGLTPGLSQTDKQIKMV